MDIEIFMSPYGDERIIAYNAPDNLDEVTLRVFSSGVKEVYYLGTRFVKVTDEDVNAEDVDICLAPNLTIIRHLAYKVRRK